MRLWLYYKPFVVKTDNNMTSTRANENVAWRSSGNCDSVFFFSGIKHYNAVLKCGDQWVFSVSGSLAYIILIWNKLRFSERLPKSHARSDFKTDNKKSRCPLRTFVASVSSLTFLTNFHHKWRTDAGHSKTTVQENDKNWNKKKKWEKEKAPRPRPRPRTRPRPRSRPHALATTILKCVAKFFFHLQKFLKFERQTF